MKYDIRMKQFRKSNEEGAAAMLTVIFISMILLILTIGFLRLSIIENRQSGDADLALRAFYATESGVEEAKRAIRDLRTGALDGTTLRKDECLLPDHPSYDPVLSPPDRFDVEITCMLLDIEPFEFEFNLGVANKTVKVPLDVVDDGTPAPDDLTSLVIEWHTNSDPGDGGDGEIGAGSTLRAGGDDTLLNVPDWAETNGHPAMMDINIFKRPQGNFIADDLGSYHIYANPTDVTAPDYAVFPGSVPGPQHGEVVNSSCYDTAAIGQYVCRVVLTDFPAGNDYFLQISNLYRSAGVRVTPYVGADNRQFDGGQATVDVTARSGDAYRRVRASILLAEPALLPDATISSSGSICKDFAITDDPSDFIADPGTSCGP